MILQRQCLLIWCILAVCCVAIAEGQSCDSNPCLNLTICDGFRQTLCTDANNQQYNGYCFFNQFCSSYSEVAGDLSINIDGASPAVIFPYYSDIKKAVMDAYNNYCRTSDNYRRCCPGAISWPNRLSEANNKSAMEAFESEVNIPASKGAERNTVIIIRLAPRRSSALCNAVEYPFSSTTTQQTLTSGSPMTSGSPLSSASPTTHGNTVPSGSLMTSGSPPSPPPSGSPMTSGSPPSPPPSGSPMTSGSPPSPPPTGSPMTSGSPPSPLPSETPTPSGRRRRDLADFLGDLANNNKILQRSRRSSMPTITLPADTMNNIVMTINLKTIIQSTLSAKNISVTITITTVGASSPAARPESSYALVGFAGALMRIIMSTFRRNM